MPQGEARAALEAAAGAILRRWTVLNMAVENQWGGENSVAKADALLQELIGWLFDPQGCPCQDELAELLDEALSDDFHVDLQDGSPQQVAEALLAVYFQCANGDTSGAATLVQQEAAMRAQAAAALEQSRRVKQDQRWMMEAPPDLGPPAGAGAQEPPPAPEAPMVDEDGFETVARGRRRR